MRTFTVTLNVLLKYYQGSITLVIFTLIIPYPTRVREGPLAIWMLELFSVTCKACLF